MIFLFKSYQNNLILHLGHFLSKGRGTRKRFFLWIAKMKTLRSSFVLFLVISVIAAFFLIFLIPSIGCAQATNLQALRARIEQMEKKVNQLETLLEECERAREEAIGAALGWQSKKNWRKLKVGMEESQVKAILGEPSKIIQGAVTLWYYPNIYGGYVSFDKEGKLAGWNEP